MLCNICLHFERQDGQDGKKQKEDHAIKVTKNQKTKIWEEQNIWHFALLCEYENYVVHLRQGMELNIQPIRQALHFVSYDVLMTNKSKNISIHMLKDFLLKNIQL